MPAVAVVPRAVVRCYGGVGMHAQLKDGSLRLRLGNRFGVPEAERVREAVRAFAPLRQFTLDFTDVRELEPPACAVVAKLLSARFVRTSFFSPSRLAIRER